MILVYPEPDAPREVCIPMAVVVSFVSGARVDAYLINVLPHGKLAFNQWLDAQIANGAADPEGLILCDLVQLEAGGYEIRYSISRGEAVQVAAEPTPALERAASDPNATRVEIPEAWVSGGPVGKA